MPKTCAGRPWPYFYSFCRCAAVLMLLFSFLELRATAAQRATEPSSPSAQEPVRTTDEITVVGVGPLPGMDLPEKQVPSPVQTATDRDIAVSGAADLSDFLNRNLNGVHINEVQSNPFQPDVNYRGYTASPLLGTPQGLSVYMDGVRLNQPFGEVVNWDLIPRVAIASTTLMPGSNPLFGLNTLGGALSVQTKDGRTAKGTTIQATFGDYLRRAIEMEHGGQTTSHAFDWYVAGTLFGEDGWREQSPSDVRQLFGKAAWRRPTSELTLAAGHADNSLNGNGLQEFRLLDGDYRSVYTKPDNTRNRSTLVSGSFLHRTTASLSVHAQAYYRDLRTNTFNGDINEDALEQALYQPSAAEIASLTAAGYTGVPLSGATAANTPFPAWRCIANVLRRDEPAELCNGLINRTHSTQRNGGLAGQVTRRGVVAGGNNLFTIGAAFDASGIRFAQSSQLGYINAERGIIGLDAYADGETGGFVDGEPYDTRVELNGTIRTASVYLADTLQVGSRTHLTLSGRFNRSSIENRDQINPGGGDDSLDGHHVYSRFNPAAGLTVDLTPDVNLYAGYSEGSRAATAIELGCANPEQPCRLPNAMAGDPPLDQVVTRTVEGGLRGARGPLTWHAGLFLAENHDDILFVASEQTGFGYFRNFGQTRRRGFEAGARLRTGGLTIGTEYTFLRATFESQETVLGENNSSNEEAESGAPGLDGLITIEPGNRMPLMPQHMLKVFGDVDLTSRISAHVSVTGVSSSYARGNDNNAHEPDGLYYLGEGTIGGYAVVNLGLKASLPRQLELIGHMNNLFNREYATAAQLGPAAFTPDGAFIARPFPAINGEFPLFRSTFVAPGARFRAWAGVRARF